MFLCFTFRYDGNVKDKVPIRGFQEEVCDEGFMVEVKAERDDVDKENKMKRKKKKVPVRGFQEEVHDEGCTVKVKLEMDENKMKKKKKKIAQGHDSANGTSKKRKIDQEQSQPFPRVDQYLNERAIKNAQRKRKIAEGDKGNNKIRNIDMQVDVQKNGDEVQKKHGKKGKQTVSTYDEANVKEDVPVEGFQEEVHDEGFADRNVSSGAKLDSKGDIQNKNGDKVQKKHGKKGKQTVSTDQRKQDVSTNDEKADDGKKGKQTVSTDQGKQDVSTNDEKADDGKKGKQTVSTDQGKQDVSTNDEKVDHEAEVQEGNASEGEVKKKNGENCDQDVKPETFEVNADDDNEIIQNKSSDGQQGKWDHGKEGKQDVSTGKQEGKQIVSTYHEADAESSDDENGDADLQPTEADDNDDNEIIEIKSSEDPGDEDDRQIKPKEGNIIEIKPEVKSDEDNKVKKRLVGGKCHEDSETSSFFTANEDNTEYYCDVEEDELLMEVLTHQPTKEDFARWEEKSKNSTWIKEVTSDEDDEPIHRSQRLEIKKLLARGFMKTTLERNVKRQKNTRRK